MGLTIHYGGSLRNVNDLPKITAEVKDICETMNWSYDLLDIEDSFSAAAHEGLGLLPDKPLHLHGIHFKPHERCDSVNMVFDQRGRLFSPINLVLLGNGMEEIEPEFWYSFTKTQFAGPEVHMAIIKLMKYLDQRYLKDFWMIDEGKYWESDDEAQLRQIFQRYTAAIDAFTEALDNIVVPEGESLEGIVARVEEVIRDLLKGGNFDE